MSSDQHDGDLSNLYSFVQNNDTVAVEDSLTDLTNSNKQQLLSILLAPDNQGQTPLHMAQSAESADLLLNSVEKWETIKLISRQ